MTETGFFRGAAGTVFQMDLPLTEVMQDQATRGQLVRVNEDGSPFETEAPKRPADSAGKPAWVGYAVSRGASVDDADAMTKNDLIEKYGK